MPRQVTLFQNQATDPQNILRDRVVSFLKDKGFDVYCAPVSEHGCPVIPDAHKDPDVVIVLGGDGTFLRSARCLMDRSPKDPVPPLVGINTGKLGFLTRIEMDQMEPYLERLTQGAFGLEQRMMLKVDLPKVPFQKDPKPTSLWALNDLVIKNTNPGVMCTLGVTINNVLVATYDADGVIISTPTGSTAYNLSAGGPILSPEVPALAITPICPHSFSAKPIVIPANKTIAIQAMTPETPVMVAVDGQECGMLIEKQTLTVTKAEQTLPMIQFGEEADNFYQVLQRKLHWALNPRVKRS